MHLFLQQTSGQCGSLTEKSVIYWTSKSARNCAPSCWHCSVGEACNLENQLVKYLASRPQLRQVQVKVARRGARGWAPCSGTEPAPRPCHGYPGCVRAKGGASRAGYLSQHHLHSDPRQRPGHVRGRNTRGPGCSSFLLSSPSGAGEPGRGRRARSGILKTHAAVLPPGPSLSKPRAEGPPGGDPRPHARSALTAPDTRRRGRRRLPPGPANRETEAD